MPNNQTAIDEKFISIVEEKVKKNKLHAHCTD